MAPARKRPRTKGVLDITNLKLDDVMCPVCRSVIIEPVSLPCEHSLCYFCFDKTIESNTLTCPVCRKRIGGWLRSATRSKSIINQQFWSEIQKQFPKEVECKQAGEDDGVEDTVIGCRQLASLSIPGEIGQEFKEQLIQFSAKEREEQEKQEKASAELAKKLMEEEIRAKAEWVSCQQKVVEKDAELAKSLALEESKGNVLENGSTILNDETNKELNGTDGPSFLSGICKLKSSGSSASSSRCNSIDEEFRHFTPILPNRNSKNKPQKSDVPTSSNCVPFFKNVELVRPIKPHSTPHPDATFEKPQGPHRLHVEKSDGDDKSKSNAFFRVRQKSQDQEQSADSSDTDYEDENTPADKMAAGGSKMLSEGSIFASKMATEGCLIDTKMAAEGSMFKDKMATVSQTNMATEGFKMSTEGCMFEDGVDDVSPMYQASGSGELDTTSAVVKSMLFDELSVIPNVTAGAVADVEKMYSELEKKTMERIRQEEEDRRFALQMQEMWEKDERRKACTVTSDYKLRRKEPVTAKRTVTVTPKGTVAVPRQTTLDKHIQQVRS